MSEPGSLYEKQEIKLFVLYVLSRLSRAVPKQILTDSAMHGGLINYFQLSECIPELIDSGNIIVTDENGEQTYAISAAGDKVLRELERTLPRHARDAAERSVFSVLSTLRRDKQIRCDYKKTETGYTVNCSIDDLDEPLMSISFYVPTLNQAQHFETKFRRDAEKIYSEIIGLFSSEM